MAGITFSLVVLIAVTLPDAVTVPGINAGETVESAGTEGYQWVRILESDYTVLEVASSPAVPMTAYNNAGEPLAFSLNGDPLVLSAYSDYWFWIKAQSDEPVEFTVRYVDAEPVGSSGILSSLSSAEMAEIWTFTAEEEGDWKFLISGTDDISDLDLELYGAGNALWAGSYSTNSSEKLSLALLEGESIQVVVSRYNKGGSGDYSLEIMRSGEMDVLTGSLSGDAISGSIKRFKLPVMESEALLELTFENQGDIDLLVRDSHGEVLYSSTTYLYSEGLVIPAGDSPSVVEVLPYDVGEGLEAFPYRLNLVHSSEEIREARAVEVETGYGSSALLRFIAPSSGFYTISGLFDKLRDGDVRLFDSYGEPAVFLMTERGNESFSFWTEQGDTLWISPGFMDSASGGLCRVSVEPTVSEPVVGQTHGRIDETTNSQKFYTVHGEAGSTLVIELRGDQRDFDLDMLVSGPGYALQAQGGLSNTDSAADESVALYCQEDAVYGVTVYAYTRDGEGTFTLETERIPSETLAPGNTASADSWAVVAGISGYESRADILSRSSMDAIEFYRFLRDDQNIDSDHMVLLVDAEARADAFRNAVSDICQRAGSDDRLILFYSGHGSQEPPGSGGSEESDGVNEVLCFYNEDISDDEMHDLVSGFPGSVYLFTDACNSGGFVNDFSQGDNILILTAAREDKSVSERVLTPILLEGSRGAADSNGNGVITAEELVEYVDSMMARICPVCDSVVDEGMVECPECGTVLKGEYRIPRPEQGLFLNPDESVWE
ncbi:MAG: caspase family protein [Candidatus Sabulitectum sp.]|nr:caspase family protein [Candidatus Sabulitectum sp.]